MNIAMVMSVFGENAIGGAERTASVLAANLIRRGHQVSVVALGPIGSQISKKIDKHEVSIWHVPLVQRYDPYSLDGTKNSLPPSAVEKALWHLGDIYNRAMAKSVKYVFQEIKPDIVMTHTLQGFSVSVWTEAKRAGAKLVHMTHDHALICPATAMTRGSKVCEKVCKQCAVYGNLRHMFAVKPDAVVGPSKIILERHHRFGWFNDVEIMRAIPNALPEDWPFAVTPMATQHPLIFGFLGRIDESKGIDTLLEALAHLLHGTFKVKIAGQGDADQAKQRWLSSSVQQESVEFVGLVNAADFLNQVDVLVTPSRAHETFCNVVMEAGCLGRPAIVSDSGALPERVAQGASGWIFPAGDAMKLARTMQYCIDHPDQVLVKGLAALQARPTYDVQRQCTSFESLCKELVS
jgi:glycosyltransferase involved in cell wall biosynthesis